MNDVIVHKLSEVIPIAVLYWSKIYLKHPLFRKTLAQQMITSPYQYSYILPGVVIQFTYQTTA